MLFTTKGIVLHSFKYSESSIIVKIYTLHFGMQSYILKGVSNKKNKSQKAFLQPLSLVEINVYHKEKKGLQSLKSIKPEVIYQTVLFNVEKITIAFFIAEILEKLIKEEEPNENLFEFLHYSFQYLDADDDNYIDFHLIFLAQLSKYLGFFPQNVNEEMAHYFDYENGEFKKVLPNHTHFLEKEIAGDLKQIFIATYASKIKLTSSKRRQVLNAMIDYYTLHFHNLSNLKSIEVLKELYL